MMRIVCHEMASKVGTIINNEHVCFHDDNVYILNPVFRRHGGPSRASGCDGELSRRGRAGRGRRVKV